jgi:hypothetical protein
MSETTDEFLGIVCRSLLRHAIVGVATGGVGNIFVGLGDLLDISDTLDALDTITSTDSSPVSGDGEVHFGSDVHPSDGCLVDKQTGVCFSSSPYCMFKCSPTIRLATLAHPITIPETEVPI